MYPLKDSLINLLTFCIVLLVLSLPAQVASAQSLTLLEVDLPTLISAPASVQQPDQLPQSRIAVGNRDVALAWFAGPTARYQHGVLGDRLEASRLVVQKRDGDTLMFELPASRVFEDLEPRLTDLDGNNRDEILVIESDVSRGAALAVYAIQGEQLALRAMTPFIGRPNRWLNPVGAGDFDGDGRLDVAIVVTPHIGGILRLYHFDEPTLSLFAEASGVSTHRIGSTELGLGRVIALGTGRDGLLLPDQSRQTLILFEWTSNTLHELARVRLPSPIVTSLRSVGDNRWHFQLESGRSVGVQLD